MIDALPITVMSTSAVVMNNDQDVYLMPGNNSESQTSSSLIICHLNTGPASQFPREVNKTSYGYAMTQHHWQKLEVKH